MVKQKKSGDDSHTPEVFSDDDVRLMRELFVGGMSIEDIAAKFERDPVVVGHIIRRGNTELLHCSFCNRNQKEVTLLIAGLSAYICDGCLDTCLQIVSGERPDLVQVRVGPGHEAEME